MPIAYALNRAIPAEQSPRVAALATVTQQQLTEIAPNSPPPSSPYAVLTEYVRTGTLNPNVVPALAALTGTIGNQLRQYGTMENIPAQSVSNTRNDMYLASETIKHIKTETQLNLSAQAKQDLDALKTELDNATRFIPGGSKW